MERNGADGPRSIIGDNDVFSIGIRELSSWPCAFCDQHCLLEFPNVETDGQDDKEDFEDLNERDE